MNKIFLIGRLTKDPELRYTPSGAAVCSFTLAVDRRFTSQSGEKEADFIHVVVRNKAAENCAKYLSKAVRLRSKDDCKSDLMMTKTASADG